MYEKSRAPLALMEQLIMLFIFTMAAVTCMQAFIYSSNLSKNDEIKYKAMNHAREVVEYCKEYRGDLEEVAKELGGSATNNGLIVKYAKDEMLVTLLITQKDKYLVQGEVRVLSNDNLIYKLEVAYQNENK